MIPFNKALCLENSIECIKDVMQMQKLCGDGKYTKLCSKLMEEKFHAKKVLLTTSGTSALEMAAILLDIKPGDEVIMPSYTFVTTATAFVLQGAKIVFVDIRPDTMNIDENLIEQAISNKTTAIVVVHYAGVACNMEKITQIANKYNLPIVEDAAQGVMSTYNGKYLGTIGDLGCYSFHDTKNYTMGEGGAIIINNEKYIERAEILREKGTDRSKFFRGEVDKYSWVDIGSSYLPSEINAAYLYPQLKIMDEININRKIVWEKYFESFKILENEKIIELPYVPEKCVHNSHMFWIKLKDFETRTKYIKYMKNEKNIGCIFHFIPLHSSKAGMKYGKFFGKDRYTTKESDRLVRMPIYYQIPLQHVEEVIELTYRWLNIERQVK